MKEMQANKAGETAPEPDDPNNLTAKQEQALLALLSHPTLKEASLATGISESTLWRYMQDEEFSRRLYEARREAVSHAVTRLQRAAGDAVTVLCDLMMKEDAPPAARISAIRMVLEYSIGSAEKDELKTRLAELEQFVLRKREEDALDRGLSAKRRG